jgi:hypothetical protein
MGQIKSLDAVLTSGKTMSENWTKWSVLLYCKVQFNLSVASPLFCVTLNVNYKMGRQPAAGNLYG